MEIVGTLLPDECLHIGTNVWCTRGRIAVWVDESGIVRAAFSNREVCVDLQDRLGAPTDFTLPDRIQLAA
jgi:hypothetical protein